MEPLLPTLHVECLCAILRHMDIPRVDTVKDGSMKNLAVFNYPKSQNMSPDEKYPRICGRDRQENRN